MINYFKNLIIQLFKFLSQKRRGPPNITSLYCAGQRIIRRYRWRGFSSDPFYRIIILDSVQYVTPPPVLAFPDLERKPKFTAYRSDQFRYCPSFIQFDVTNRLVDTTNCCLDEVQSSIRKKFKNTDLSQVASKNFNDFSIQSPQAFSRAEIETHDIPKLRPFKLTPLRIVKAESSNLTAISPQAIIVDVSPDLPLWMKLYGKHKPKPIERGGRPRGPSGIILGNEKASKKPEIIICKRERGWELLIEIPEELLQDSDLKVRQDLNSLEQEQFTNRWNLRDITGNIEISMEKDASLKYMMPLRKKRLIFKLGGGKLDHGRIVKSVSLGVYLVVAPENWQRDENASGVAPIEPEPVTIPGYRAHYFLIETDNDKKRIVFRDSKGEQKIIGSQRSKFELVGNLLQCSSDDMSPIYGESLPRLRTLAPGAWEEVKTIIVGEEGPGLGKWRKELAPPVAKDREELPIDLEEKGDGWYFLRVYDLYENLLESLDFHFISSLRKISYSLCSSLPAQSGHQTLVVELFHESDCTVFPVCECAHRIPVERQENKTILNIDPDPSLDKSLWSLGEYQKVEIPILAERIWWAFGEEGKIPEKWTDVSCLLKRSEFRATSESALWLKLPRKRFIKTLSVGFTKEEARVYSIKVDDEICSSPFRELEGCPEVSDVTIEQYLRIWIDDCEDSATVGVLEIPVLRCCKCNYSSRSKDGIIDHVISVHLYDLVKEVLDYNFIRFHLEDLPYKIYKCHYCPIYVKSDDLDNPTSAICDHVENKCEEALKEAMKMNRRVKVMFSIIDNIHEIRKHVIKDLPHFYRCSLCSKLFKNPTEQKMIDHLLHTHDNSLYVSEI